MLLQTVCQWTEFSCYKSMSVLWRYSHKRYGWVKHIWHYFLFDKVVISVVIITTEINMNSEQSRGTIQFNTKLYTQYSVNEKWLEKLCTVTVKEEYNHCTEQCILPCCHLVDTFQVLLKYAHFFFFSSQCSGVKYDY